LTSDFVEEFDERFNEQQQEIDYSAVMEVRFA
jgi:hypothetical protein